MDDELETEIDLRDLPLGELTQLYREAPEDAGVFLAMREKVSERDPLLAELDLDVQMVALAIRSLVIGQEELTAESIAAAFRFDIEVVRNGMDQIHTIGWVPVA